MEKNRELLAEMGYENSVVFIDPNYDDAIIGVSAVDDRVIYDFDKMVQCLVKEDGMSEEEAIEFIEYNTLRAIPYMPNGPIVLNRLIED